jgi:flagellar assembly protein FliH
MSSRTDVGKELVENGAQTFVYRPAGLANPFNGATNDSEDSSEASRNEISKREQQAWQNGLAEGRAQMRAEAEKSTTELRTTVKQALESFARERETYFGRVEEEIVRLSLSIARKILNREALIDPMLLTGLVHVALEKMDSGTQMRLRAHPSRVVGWRDHFRGMPEGKVTPEVIGDDTLSEAQCALETELGSTEISLEGHLKEIEQGFFDLLAERPRPA